MTNVSTAVTTPAIDKPVICFGRFMIDLPLGAVPGLATATEYRFGTLLAERVSPDPRIFSDRIETREEEMKKGVNTQNFAYSSTQRFSSDRRNGAIFLSDRDLFGDRVFRFEAHWHAGSTLFSMAQGPYKAKQISSIVSIVQNDLLPRVRSRRPDEIPTDPGLCTSDGFIASDGSERALEAVNLSLELERWPDLRLGISVATEHKGQPSSLERRKERHVPDHLRSLIGQVRTLREGQHDVGSIRAEESLVTMPTDDGYRIHLFRWESIPELDDPFKPSIIVKLETGAGQNGGRHPTIIDKEAVELFDAVVNSIRLRPTRPVKSSATEPPNAPLGTTSTTGHRCLQSGLWRAKGGEQRFIPEGETMPKTQVAVTSTLWRRLRGEQSIGMRATHWTLIAFETPAAEAQPESSGAESASTEPAPTVPSSAP
jgi:hypothetical protein